MKESRSQQIILLLKGFCMGAADVVPGVSGGTMALILGIYVRLINAIRSFDAKWLTAIFRLDAKTIFGRPDFVFLIPLLGGIGIALFFFTRVVSLPGLIESDPVPVYALFTGLITGSVCVLLYQVRDGLLKGLIFILLGAVGGYLVFNLVPVNTPETSWFVFLCGAIAITAMILPGLSGSFILLILKKYSYIFHAIGHLQFSILLPFVLGIICGLALFSRILGWLLRKFYKNTILFICGLLIGSLSVVWPFQQRNYQILNGKKQLLSVDPYIPSVFTQEIIVAIVLMVTGIMVVVWINYHSENGF